MTTAAKSWLSYFIGAWALCAIGQPVQGQAIARDSMDRLIQRMLDEAHDSLYYNMERSDKILTVADSLTRLHFPSPSEQYLRLLDHQFKLFKEKNDLTSAAMKLEEMDVLRAALGMDGTTIHARHLFHRSVLLVSKGKLNEAVTYAEKALAMFQETGADNSADAAFNKGSLANIYRRRQQVREAETLLGEALATLDGLYGRKSAPSAHILYDLGLVYKAGGELQKAEAAFLESTAIRKEVLGELNMRYAFGLNGVAGIYKTLGNYPEAEKYYRDALRIIRVISGDEDANYASTLNNLGGLFMEKERYNEAADSYKEVLELRKRLLGERHPLYAASLNNYSAALYYHKDYTLAAEKFKEAIDLRVQLVGKDKDYGMYLGNLAECQLALGDFDRAEMSFRSAAGIFDSLGIEALSAQAQGALARFFQVRGRWDEAMESFGTCMEYYQEQMQLATNFLSDDEIARYQSTYRNFKSGLFSTAWQATGLSTDQAGFLYDQILFEKDFILASVQRLRKLAKGSDTASALLQQLKEAESKLVAEKGKIGNKRDPERLDSLQQEITAIKKELSRTVSAYEKLSRSVSWKEVRDGLKEGEAAVEFFHFTWGIEGLTDSVLYAALVLTPGADGPLFIPLFEERSLKDILSVHTEGASAIASLYAPRGGILLDEQVPYGDTLYRMVWAPLASALKGARSVYYSPSGLLHRINLEVIPVGGEGGLVMDRFRMRHVSSSRYRPMDHGLKEVPNGKALLLGGLHYEPQDDTDPEVKPANELADLVSADPGTRSGFEYLPASLQEVKDIGRYLKRAGFTVETWTGAQGTEARLKDACAGDRSSPSVLHMATHGFYLDPATEVSVNGSDRLDYWQQFATEEPDPMMRSGLALAGANGNLEVGESEIAPIDGIFTAREIAQLDLAATRLVVLSACETAKGDLLGAEGVYGLQRAFRIAGAGKMIVSLWRVPDAATADFMARFYRECAKGKQLHEAFLHTRRAMRKGRPFHEWGAWVLLE